MTGDKLLDKLLDSFAGSYDIETDFSVMGDVYDAHAYLDVTNAGYVLVKKAELWRANCYEHIFLKIADTVTLADLDSFSEQVIDYFEPHFVRFGKKYPPKNHMYTYITMMYIAENGVSEEVIGAVESFRYSRDYLLTLRGYCDVRMVVFDIREKMIYGNRAADELVKGYSEQERIWR